MKQNNDISLLLYDLEGRQLFAKSAVSQLSGHYHETIQIEKQSRGKYLLIIIVGDKKYVEKIVNFKFRILWNVYLIHYFINIIDILSLSNRNIYP